MKNYLQKTLLTLALLGSVSAGWADHDGGERQLPPNCFTEARTGKIYCDQPRRGGWPGIHRPARPGRRFV